MRKHYLYILLFIVALVSLGIAVYLKNTGAGKGAETVTMSVQGRSVKLLVADDQAEWTYGLMNRRSLPEADGMIFIFPDKQTRTFWNMNTLMDLQVVWMDGSRVLGTGELPSIEKSGETVSIHSPAPADRVIELVQ